ncbi:MAG TPA: acyl-CoA dehydrogenase family protein [Actinomycetota bacterium]
MDTGTILKNVEGVLPAIREQREAIEQARRLPREVVDRLIGTGVFGLNVPRAIGGPEASPLEGMQAIERVASADGSAGWCTMIGLTSNIAAGYMNEPGAKEIFTDPSVPAAAIAGPIGQAVPSEGGYRVSGRWPFASGITHAPWVWAGCLVMENGAPKMTPHGPAMVHAFLPTKDIEIHDTWYVSGLAGTGSNDFSAADVFVPEHLTFSLFDPTGHRSEPLYQIPVVNLFVAQVASVSLGIARAALDELTELAATKVPTLSQVPLADKPVAQIELARMEAALGGGRAFLFDVVEQLYEIARAGGTASMRLRALGRAAAVNAVEVAASVTRQATTLVGGSALYSSSAMQRHARDAAAITHHFTVSSHTWEEAGRVLLGREPTVPLF